MTAKRKTVKLENFSKPEVKDDGLVTMTNGKKDVRVKPMHVTAYEFMGYNKKEEPPIVEREDSPLDGGE
jgi:hypothetical protein